MSHVYWKKSWKIRREFIAGWWDRNLLWFAGSKKYRPVDKPDTFIIQIKYNTVLMTICCYLNDVFFFKLEVKHTVVHYKGVKSINL